MPDTRPNLKFDKNGHCNCEYNNSRSISIDWSSRREEFLKYFDGIKQVAEYDCLIPVSGGKDSTWQTKTALDLGLRPLCLTWKTPGRNAIGQKNLTNLINMGVDHFDVSINHLIDRKIVKLSFVNAGSPAIPMHRLIRGVPLRVAQAMSIPVILDGENSAYEYGGDNLNMGGVMDNEWLKRYGVVEGITDAALDRVSMDQRDVNWYRVPNLDAARESGLSVLFMGYYFKWSPEISKATAISAGFTPSKTPIVGSWTFADVDDDFIIPVHHWMKWFKFGFTRQWDNLSSEIRAGIISRREAIEILRNSPELEPTDAINKFIDYIKITRKEFDDVCDKFRNKNIWIKDKMGKWKIKDFLISEALD